MPYEPWASSSEVRKRMQGNRGRDTLPELRLRRLLHRRGLRYLVDTAPVAGVRRRADVVFRGARIAVFVDGCFWHGCEEHLRPAKTNAGYWRAKVEANQRRDRDTDSKLREAGWTPLRVWEHEDVAEAAHRIEKALKRDDH